MRDMCNRTFYLAVAFRLGDDRWLTSIPDR